MPSELHLNSRRIIPRYGASRPNLIEVSATYVHPNPGEWGYMVNGTFISVSSLARRPYTTDFDIELIHQIEKTVGGSSLKINLG